MAADTREQILARFLTIIESLPGVGFAGRNVDDISESKMPAIILYDGDEEAADNPRATGQAPNVVHMLPSIVSSLANTPENVGTSTNEWRAKILKAVLGDSSIATICRGVPNGGVRYLGCNTSLSAGRTSQLQLICNFSVGYAFKPASL